MLILKCPLSPFSESLEVKGKLHREKIITKPLHGRKSPFYASVHEVKYEINFILMCTC